MFSEYELLLYYLFRCSISFLNFLAIGDNKCGRATEHKAIKKSESTTWNFTKYNVGLSLTNAGLIAD